jgi:hypothetical protein
MTNGQLPTWFVLRWLEEHPGHIAKALNIAYLWSCVASRNGERVTLLSRRLPGLDLSENIPLPLCNDWTLYRADGNPVRFKKRYPLKHAGVLNNAEVLRIGEATWRSSAVDVEFDIFVRERT